MSLPYSKSVPAIVVLIIAIVGILLLVLPAREMTMPSENMERLLLRRANESVCQLDASNEMWAAPTLLGDVNLYGVILDAGSSHTSMYIYKWPGDKLNGTGIVTQHSECNVEGGGISSYSGVPGGAAKSLETCLEQALKDIPKFRHHQTPLYLGATAGMRLLNIINATESTRILKEVENKLRSYPFKFKKASILSGQEEGAYGWVTVNYLLENFAKYGFVGRWLNPGRDTIGALDLGGASTQITFETLDNVEDKDNEMKLNLYGQTYRLYTQSFLCYGQDQVLRKLLAHLIKTNGLNAQLEHPCYPRGFRASIKLGKDVFDSPCTENDRPAQFDRQMDVSVVGTGNYESCLDNVKKLFSFSNCPYSKCSFNGVFQPSVRGNFMAFSAFYFTHNYLTTLTNISITSPSQLKKAIKIVCNMTISEMIAKTNQRSEKHVKNACSITNYVQVLLTEGYSFNETSLPSISFQKTAGGASVGWALGFMLNVTNMVPAESLGVMKALPSGPWVGNLILFITLLIIAGVYLVMVFKKGRDKEGMV